MIFVVCFVFTVQRVCYIHKSAGLFLNSKINSFFSIHFLFDLYLIRTFTNNVFTNDNLRTLTIEFSSYEFFFYSNWLWRKFFFFALFKLKSFIQYWVLSLHFKYSTASAQLHETYCRERGEKTRHSHFQIHANQVVPHSLERQLDSLIWIFEHKVSSTPVYLQLLNKKCSIHFLWLAFRRLDD